MVDSSHIMVIRYNDDLLKTEQKEWARRILYKKIWKDDAWKQSKMNYLEMVLQQAENDVKS